MNDDMISRREADAKIDALRGQVDGLVDLVKEVRGLLQESGRVSGVNATEIALVKQRLDGHDRWRWVWGAAAIAAMFDFIVRRVTSTH